MNKQCWNCEFWDRENMIFIEACSLEIPFAHCLSKDASADWQDERSMADDGENCPVYKKIKEE